jgi:hypothetical protein
MRFFKGTPMTGQVSMLFDAGRGGDVFAISTSSPHLLAGDGREKVTQ